MSENNLSFFLGYFDPFSDRILECSPFPLLFYDVFPSHTDAIVLSMLC